MVLETMNLFEILTVAIPENIIVSILTLLLYKKENKLALKQTLFRLFVTNGYLLACIYYIRQNISDLMVSGIIYLLLLTLNYKIIWKYNIRQSLLLSFVYIFIIDLAEGITSPMINILIKQFSLSSLLDNTFIITLPSRMFEILIVFIIYFNKLRLNGVLFEKNMNELKKNDTFVLISIFILLSLGMVLYSNNANLYVKLNELDINIFTVEFYLKINLLIPLAFMFLICLLLIRINKYYEFREILQKTPNELLIDIIDVSNSSEIENYITILNKHLLKGGEIIEGK